MGHKQIKLVIVQSVCQHDLHLWTLKGVRLILVMMSQVKGSVLFKLYQQVSLAHRLPWLTVDTFNLEGDTQTHTFTHLVQ